MKKILRVIPILALLVLASQSGCQKQGAETAMPLAKLNWYNHNYLALNKLVNDYGEGGRYFDRDQPPYAVLDWDQTCAFLDVEEALMRYQLMNFRFKLSPEQFRGLLKDEINGVSGLSEAYRSVSLADIHRDLAADYDSLYRLSAGPGGGLPLEELRLTPWFGDFIARLPWLYDGYCGTSGIGAAYGYPWIIGMLAGHTVEEVKTMAKEAIDFELANRLGKQTWDSPAGFETHSGPVSYSYKSGLRVLPEMQNLISVFMNRNIGVFIVSASYKPVVEVFSGLERYGYNIPADHVIAMELAVDGDGKILPHYKEGWVQTQEQGKVEAINRVIIKAMNKNSDPLFSAGDSDGDYAMMTGFPDMKMRLTWNRLKGGNIGSLCKKAVDDFKSTFPAYLLQGRNENTGMAIPGPETILLGRTDPQLLYGN
jgi:phosphoserine phosphatase